MNAPAGTAELRADVVIAGIGLGAIAAAMAVVRAGRTAVIAGPESRIGGQVTAQLTAPLDEHPHIETAGCSASYRAFREEVRREYGGVANPGGGWVSRLCFEPLTGERVLSRMLAPAIDAGRLTVVTRATPVEVERSGDRLVAVRFRTPAGVLRVAGDVVIDATETGDLLPLAGVEWIVGSEGRDAFGEPHALPGGPDPRAEQSCTIVAALVRDDEPGAVGAPPEGYAELRDAQPFSLTLANDADHEHTFPFFDDRVEPGSFWSYRRVRDPRQVGGPDAAIINWHGNDWYGSPLTAEPERTDAAARRLAAAFVHWLRTEAPRGDGAATGYHELRLAPEISGTPDGLAETPYVRESRRLASAEPVTEHDLAPVPGLARAAAFDDAVGIAWYHADLHPRVGGHASVYAPTSPFQVPLRALVSSIDGAPANLVAGAKDLAATQVAAAAYRVHHGEWAVGEAAGALGAVALERRTSPAGVVADPAARVAVQVALLRADVPIVWATDLHPAHPAFVAGSLLAAHGGLDADRLARLDVRPDEPAGAEAVAALSRAAALLAARFDLEAPAPPERAGASWADLARALADPILTAADALGQPGALHGVTAIPSRHDHE
ncbi:MULTISPECIES: FAD-dependent oxidoreductase [unclassified Agromyces]|uniref:FAD-dependent oxidoreductase n=1 Tax=unclassified Agromyces TaxID=2639701 RepID=UPI00301481D8